MTYPMTYAGSCQGFIAWATLELEHHRTHGKPLAVGEVALLDTYHLVRVASVRWDDDRPGWKYGGTYVDPIRARYAGRVEGYGWHVASESRAMP